MKYKNYIVVGLATLLFLVSIIIENVHVGEIGHNKVVQLVNADVKVNIQDYISKAILENEESDRYDFLGETHYILHTSTNDENDTIIHAMVLLKGYDIENDIFNEVFSNYFPVEITFRELEGREYVVKEYWKPGENGNLKSDIESRFPKIIVPTALGEPKYGIKDIQKLYREVIEYGNINTEKMIGDIIKENAGKKEIMPSYGEKVSQRELVYFGDYMLDYAYTKFLEGDIEEGEGKVMEQAVRAILNQSNEDIDLNAESGQQWFDAYYKNIKGIEEEKGLEYIKNNMPKAYKLILMDK